MLGGDEKCPLALVLILRLKSGGGKGNAKLHREIHDANRFALTVTTVDVQFGSRASAQER